MGIKLFKTRKFLHVLYKLFYILHGIICTITKNKVGVHDILLSEKHKFQTLQRRKIEHRIYFSSILSLSGGFTGIIVKNDHYIKTQ